jgi:hypothetical protein|tara:strand:- start:282 stop:521 length:240 start_codon:yes stop_codon:yes gene_type:complete
MNKFITLSALVILLSSCGDSEESATQQPESAAPKQESAAKPAANNLFAKEQQLIEDAKGIQSLLDQNADEKKQAVNSAN